MRDLITENALKERQKEKGRDMKSDSRINF